MRGVGRVLSCLVPAAFAAALAGRADAGDGRTSSLSWLRMPGADSCIATQALARSVEDRLGRPGKVFVSAAQADVSVEGRIEKKKEGWHAVISIRDAQGALLGTRELDRPDPSCDAMSEPLAFVIAVMIDPEAAMRDRSKESPAAASATTTASSAPPPPLPPPPATSDNPPPPPPPKKSEPWIFEGGAAATLAAGLTPSVALGGAIEAILYPPGVPVGFRGFTALYPSVFGLGQASADGARASFDLLYAGGSVCPTLRRRVNLMLCLGGHLGAIRVHADTANRGIDDGSILPIWNAVLEGRVSIPIVHPIGIAGGLGATLPLLRPSFDFKRSDGTTTDTLFKVSPVALTASAGVELMFP
ncbi:MAG TPA: hypothetical protein VIF62_14290 [Labilithrix sp.]